MENKKKKRKERKKCTECIPSHQREASGRARLQRIEKREERKKERKKARGSPKNRIKKKRKIPAPSHPHSLRGGPKWGRIVKSPRPQPQTARHHTRGPRTEPENGAQGQQRRTRSSLWCRESRSPSPKRAVGIGRQSGGSGGGGVHGHPQGQSTIYSAGQSEIQSGRGKHLSRRGPLRTGQ